LWNAAKGRSKIVSKQPALEPLTALLARDLPGPIQSACAALEAERSTRSASPSSI
jgi:hypothetical protein